MNIAIIGAGISGITAAEHLAEEHQVTLFESNSKIGGHADTHSINVEGKYIDVDTGFIVFNPENYPTFCSLLDKYNVHYQESDMSFAVSNQKSGFEYNATSIPQLFCQKSNLFRPRFYRMLYDIFRFYRESTELLNDQTDVSLGQYLEVKGYSQTFIDEHIIPMACALWSGDSQIILDFPAKYLIAFMNNHNMLKAFERPVWKTIKGGSKAYLEAFSKNAKFSIKVDSQIKSVKRTDDKVFIRVNDKELQFDKVIFSCHSDQALRILEHPSIEEKKVLGAIKYQKNFIQLHHDTSVLPKRKKAWASWNVLLNDKSQLQCTVSYYMNLLQSLDVNTPVIVSLNMQDAILPEKVWLEKTYSHPVYTKETIDAQKKKPLIQGNNNSYYCGAYWGWGFHEDGARSGLEAAEQLLSDIKRA